MSNTIIPVGTKVRISGDTQHDGKTGVVWGYFTHLGLSVNPKDIQPVPYPYEVMIFDEEGPILFARAELTVVEENAEA